MIAGMFAVAVLASVIPDAFHGETASFALASGRQGSPSAWAL
jgi:low temperature requirement protein LtrA